jgi:hypothetical protein
MAAEYSARPLAEKLGIKSDTRIALIGAPRGYRTTLGTLPPGDAVATLRAAFLIQFFTKRRAALGRSFLP